MNLKDGIPSYLKYRLNWLDKEAINRVKNKLG